MIFPEVRTLLSRGAGNRYCLPHFSADCDNVAIERIQTLPCNWNVLGIRFFVTHCNRREFTHKILLSFVLTLVQISPCIADNQALCYGFGLCCSFRVA